MKDIWIALDELLYQLLCDFKERIVENLSLTLEHMIVIMHHLKDKLKENYLVDIVWYEFLSRIEVNKRIVVFALLIEMNELLLSKLWAHLLKVRLASSDCGTIAT